MAAGHVLRLDAEGRLAETGRPHRRLVQTGEFAVDAACRAQVGSPRANRLGFAALPGYGAGNPGRICRACREQSIGSSGRSLGARGCRRVLVSSRKALQNFRAKSTAICLQARHCRSVHPRTVLVQRQRKHQWVWHRSWEERGNHDAGLSAVDGGVSNTTKNDYSGHSVVGFAGCDQTIWLCTACQDEGANDRIASIWRDVFVPETDVGRKRDALVVTCYGCMQRN